MVRSVRGFLADTNLGHFPYFSRWQNPIRCFGVDVLCWHMSVACKDRGCGRGEGRGEGALRSPRVQAHRFAGKGAVWICSLQVIMPQSYARVPGMWRSDAILALGGWGGGWRNLQRAWAVITVVLFPPYRRFGTWFDVSQIGFLM